MNGSLQDLLEMGRGIKNLEIFLKSASSSPIFGLLPLP